MIDQFRGGSFKSHKDKQLRSLILMNFLCVVFLVLSVGIFVFLYSSPSEATQTKSAAVVVQREPTIKMVDVLVPVRAIDANESLNPSMFRVEPRPESAVSERMVRDFNEIQQAYARSTIMPNEPLSRDFLTMAKPTNVVRSIIPPGYRAVSIVVDITSVVEGWANAQARVDVSWIASSFKGPKLNIISQNAVIVSAGRNTSQNQDPNQPVPGTVTLMVPAKDAAKIQLAAATGKIILALRGEKDHQASEVTDVTLNDLNNKAHDNGEEKPQGYARFSSKGGAESEEMYIINNQLVRKRVAK